jgi:hypothetical protein
MAMAQTTYNTPATGPRTFGAGYLFGIPVKDMGIFATLLMGFASGFLGFFAATFVGIVSILFYNSTGHHTVDYAYSYTRLGLPVGIVCGVLALSYLGMLWVRRQVARK